MDKYRMEVERLKERDRKNREEGVEDELETRWRFKRIPTHFKIALFIAGLLIAGFIFKISYAIAVASQFMQKIGLKGFAKFRRARHENSPLQLSRNSDIEKIVFRGDQWLSLY